MRLTPCCCARVACSAKPLPTIFTATSHRTITGGVGHNLPQEAPQALAQAIFDVDGYAGSQRQGG